MSFSPFTLNDKLTIDLGGATLSLGQCPAPVQFRHTGIIAREVKRMHQLGIDKSSSQMVYLLLYKNCVDALWELFKRSAGGWFSRRKVRRIFYRRSYQDPGFFLDLVNEVYQYWLWLGEWIALLGEGRSHQMIHGKQATASYFSRALQAMRSPNYLIRRLSHESSPTMN